MTSGRMWLAGLLVLAGCTAVGPPSPASPSPAAEPALLIDHARVWGAPQADAVLVRGNRIANVGRAAALQAQAPDAQVLDARGGLVLPGLHDAHMHLLSAAEAKEQLDLSEAKSEADVAGALAHYAWTRPHDAWLMGQGWSYDVAPGGVPTRQTLDKVVSNRPVVLQSYDGHSIWVNSKALELAGIGPETPDPLPARIGREADGRTPNGMLYEDAQDLVMRHVPVPSREQRLAKLEDALRDCLRLGLTSITTLDGPDELALLATLEQQGRLPLRVTQGLPLFDDLDQAEALRAAHHSPFLRVGLLKGFVDGVIETKTAWMLEPYAGSDERGRPEREPQAFIERVCEVHARGFAVALHAIGDAAVRLALDAYAEAERRQPGTGLRNRVEHIEVCHPDDLGRFAELGVIASMQPLHADPGGADPDSGVWSRNLGPARLPLSFPWRALLDHGATLAFGSDWPVVTQNPLPGLAVAVTRRSREGLPKGGWNAQQAISFDEAVRAYTQGAAWSEGREQELGKLEPGYLADLIVLDPKVDPTRPQTLWKGKVALTVVDGVVRWSAHQPAGAR